MSLNNKSKQHKHKLYRSILDIVTFILAFLFLIGMALYIINNTENGERKPKNDVSIKDTFFVENHTKKEIEGESKPLPSTEFIENPIQNESEVSYVEEKKAEPSRSNEKVPETIQFEATAYTAKCEGCSGITFNNTDVRNTIYDGDYRIVATDPKVIPTNSLVEVQYDDVSFFAIAADRGGAIKGYKIDILVKTKQEAINFGRRMVNVTILKEGNG